jgi:hypothetical protein
MRLRHAELKVERALEHLRSLEGEMEQYYCSTPYSVQRYNDLERGRHIIKVGLKEPGDRTYLLVGDFAYCLRCALDYVVYSLVVAHTGKAPHTQVQWPVLKQTNQERFDSYTKGMAVEAAHLIQHFQPYQGGNPKEHPIWQLHRLNNIDKHRRLSVFENWLDMRFPQLKETDDVRRDADRGEITLPLSLSQTEMRLNPRPAVWFGDAEEGLRVDVKRLRDIHWYITMEVFPLFAPFFTEAVR